MASVQIMRDNSFRATDGRIVHTDHTPNGLTADIDGDTIRLTGYFVGFDSLLCEVTSKNHTDVTHKVGQQVNVSVGHYDENTEGELLKITTTHVMIRPYKAKTAKKVPLYIFSAMNRTR